MTDRSRADDIVKKLLEEPETEKLLLESAHLFKLRAIGERRLVTLGDMEVFYPRFGEKLAFSRWLREQALRYIRLNCANPIILECLNDQGGSFKLNLTNVQNNWIQLFFDIKDEEIESESGSVNNR